MLAAVQAYVLRDAIRLARAVQAPVLGAAQGLAWHRAPMIALALARGPVREAVREAALEVAPEAVTQLARRIAQITVLVSAPADVRAAALVRVMGALRLVRAAVEAAVLIIAQVNVSSNAVRRVRMTAPAAV